MAKRTEKYVAAVDTATQYRVTRARTHGGLYGALEAAGFRWDSIDRRWLNVRGSSSAGWGGPVKYGDRWPQTSPRKPAKLGAAERTAKAKPSAKSDAKPEPLQGLLPALAPDLAELTALVGRLSARVEVLDRALRLLQSVPEISRFLASSFGLELAGLDRAELGTLRPDV